MPSIRILLYDPRAGFVHDFPADRLDERVGHPEQVFWLDVGDPTEAEVELLRAEFGLHELVIEDLVRRGQRAKMDVYDQYTFVVVHGARRGGSGEIHILIGPNYLITVHRGEAPELAEVAERWRRQAHKLQSSVGTLVYALLDTLVDGYFPVVDEIAERIDQLEELILRGRTRSQLRELLDLRRELLRIRRDLTPQRDVMNALARRDDPMFGHETFVYFQDVYDHSLRILEAVDLLRDLLAGALDAHLSSVSNSLNQSVLRMTALTIILMSVTLIASIYGMNFEHMPELGWPLGYTWALGLMLAVGLGLTWIFKRIDWL